MGKFCQNISLAISVNYCWRYHLLTKVIFVKLEILYILMQWSKWFSFWNFFLYCKIIISVLELFSANCFLYILQTQLGRRNTSIPKKLKKPQHMTFMMMSSNDDKSDIYQFFFLRLIPYCQYSICTNFHVKWTKKFWDTAYFFTSGLLGSPQPWDFQKAQPRYWYY